MAKCKFKLDRSGVSKLLRSEEVKELISAAAAEIRSRCGDGYEQDIFVGKRRANAMVWAKTKRAKKDNLENNTLLKALRKKG